ncbi:MAG: prenyltransferase [Halieaceae bacterium]|nr:prenyltransferase [Halieaceae bacterium]
MSNTRTGLAALATVPSITAEDWSRLTVPVRWLIATRASVLFMTLMSAALGGLLAWRDGGGEWLPWLLCMLGLCLAHATNNLLNDLTDSKRGVDRGNYYRNQYGVHVLEDGLLNSRQFNTYLLLTGGAALATGALLVQMRGGLTLPLMAAGAFFVLFYTWPLKYIGLGEPAVLLVWGPLMVGGSYYVCTGQWSNEAAWLGALYGLGPTAVLFGKHIDKIELDREKGVRTLPVLLGSTAARQGAKLILIAQYAGCLSLVITGREHWILLAVLLTAPSLYKALKIFSEEKPQEKPERFPDNLWPLWFAPHAFALTRRFTPVFLIALLIAQWLPF